MRIPYTHLQDGLRASCVQDSRLGDLHIVCFCVRTRMLAHLHTGELAMLAGNYRDATMYMQAAITELERIDNFDCSVLIKSCVSSLHFMRSQS